MIVLHTVLLFKYKSILLCMIIPCKHSCFGAVVGGVLMDRKVFGSIPTLIYFMYHLPELLTTPLHPTFLRRHCPRFCTIRARGQ